MTHRNLATRRGGLLAALAIALLLPSSAASAASPFRLSNEQTLSRWAPVQRAVIVRAHPSPVASRVSRLSTRTHEHTTNIVLTLERIEGTDGAPWVRVRLPILPNNRTGWVPRDSLGPYTIVRTHLTIDTRRLRIILRRNGRTVFQARVGVGTSAAPTPRGHYYVRNRLTAFADPFYGPIAFGTSARSPTLTDWPGGGFIGIHGTNRPQLLPGRVSHGCIRLRNPDIVRLDRLMPVGTPITIR